jgi:hypothetical protein
VGSQEERRVAGLLKRNKWKTAGLIVDWLFLGQVVFIYAVYQN